MPATSREGSAARWGPLWGARPEDWAAQEDRQLPAYEEALERVGVGPGDRMLDVGCGSGACLELAAGRGARVAGLDASAALLAIARRRVPEADLHVGDMERLPFADDAFDVVTGFNSFFFAADMTAALAEARRVARPGAAVVIQVWGRPERCALEPLKQALAAYRPPPPPDARPTPPLWQPGLLEELAVAAGLVPETAYDFSYAMAYADGPAFVRSVAAAGGTAALLAPEALERCGAEVLAAVAAQRTADGGYVLPNEFRTLVARA